MLPNQTINEYKEGWENLTTLKKADFILVIFFTMVLLINLCLEFIDRYHSLFIVFCFIVYLIAKSIYLHPSDIIPPKKQIKEFLSEQWDKWKSRSGLKKTYYVLGSIASVILLVLLIFISFYFIETIGAKKTRFRDVALALFATLSGFGVLFGFYTSIVRTETAEQGQITDRLNKAIENLGKSDNKKSVVEVRLGALYALERIAQDSIRDHIQIIEILCAYIRHNSHWSMPWESKKAITRFKKKEPTEDIKAAIAIIGRRAEWAEGRARIKKERKRKHRINLTFCDLRDAELYRANLSRVGLLSSNMEKMVLIDANMRYAWINGANMSGTLLGGADMKSTKTDRAFAYTGDFSKCKNLTQEQLNVMFLAKGIDVPENRTHPQEGTDYDKTYNTFEDFFIAYKEWLINVYPALRNSLKNKK